MLRELKTMIITNDDGSIRCIISIPKNSDRALATMIKNEDEKELHAHFLVDSFYTLDNIQCIYGYCDVKHHTLVKEWITKGLSNLSEVYDEELISEYKKVFTIIKE